MVNVGQVLLRDSRNEGTAVHDTGGFTITTASTNYLDKINIDT